MEQKTVKKSLIVIFYSTLLFSVNVALAQTGSMPVRQNINSTEIVPKAPIEYQHFGNGRRRSRIPGGIREHCLLGAGKSFTALVPENNPVLTTVERPKLFFYIPKTSKNSVQGFELVLEDANKQVIYQKEYKVNQKSGIFSLDLPTEQNQPLLEVDREYIAIPKHMKYTPPQPSPCQGEGWGGVILYLTRLGNAIKLFIKVNFIS